MIGRHEIGQVDDGQPEQFKARPLEANRLFLPVPYDLLCLDAPDRRTTRLVFARFAGGVDAIVEDVDVAVAAFSALGREIGLVRRFDPERVDEALAEIVRNVDLVRVDLVAFAIDELDIALGEHAPCIAVVSDGLGHHARLPPYSIFTDPLATTTCRSLS